MVLKCVRKSTKAFDNIMKPYFYHHFSRLYKLLYKKSFTVKRPQETASASMEHVTNVLAVKER